MKIFTHPLNLHNGGRVFAPFCFSIFDRGRVFIYHHHHADEASNSTDMFERILFRATAQSNVHKKQSWKGNTCIRWPIIECSRWHFNELHDCQLQKYMIQLINRPFSLSRYRHSVGWLKLLINFDLFLISLASEVFHFVRSGAIQKATVPWRGAPSLLLRKKGLSKILGYGLRSYANPM